MTRTIATLASVLLLALAGCGGNESKPNAGSDKSGGASSGSSGGGGQQLALAAPEDGSLKFDKTELEGKAGTVTINFDNPSSTPHAVEIEGNGVEETTETVTGKDAPPITVDLKPGEYTYYCPVGDHRAAGMEGKLVVR